MELIIDSIALYRPGKSDLQLNLQALDRYHRGFNHRYLTFPTANYV